MDIFEVANETGIFLSGVITGFALGIIYGFLAILRAFIPHHRAVVFGEDFLYVLFFAFVLFTFSTGLTGEVRYFTLTAMLIGLTAERLSLGLLSLAIAKRLCRFLRAKIGSRFVGLITKLKRGIRRIFVKNAKISEN